MKISTQRIRELVDHPEQASSGEERRLLKILSGQGKAFSTEEKRAETYARQYKKNGRHKKKTHATKRKSQRTIKHASPSRLTKTALKKEIATLERNLERKRNSDKKPSSAEEKRARNRVAALKRELTHRVSGIRKPATIISVPMGGKPRGR